MTPPRTRAPARPYRKPVVRGEATKAQVRSMYEGMGQPRPLVPQLTEREAAIIAGTAAAGLKDLITLKALGLVEADGKLTPLGLEARRLLGPAGGEA